MLDTVSKRIHNEQKTLEDTKSKSKKKKTKKKKGKKKKHHKHSDSSSSSSENSDEEVWAESKPVEAPNSSSNKTLQRDSWMEAPIDLLPAISRQEIRDAALKEKEKVKQEAEKHLQPGQHAKELNPYWKDGGSGLPSAPQSSSSTLSSSSGATGDGGLSWMLKALSRMKQQAKDENRSLEEIAAERYGSLDRLMTMIRDAQKPRGRRHDGAMKDRIDVERRDRDRRDGDGRDRDRREGRDGDVGERRDRDGRDGRDKTDRDRKEGREKVDKGRYSGRDSDTDNVRRDKQQERERLYERSSDREKGSHGDHDDRERMRERNSSNSSRGLRFQRPVSDDEDGNGGRYRSSLSSENSRKKMFKRPGDEEEDEGGNHHKSSLSSDKSRGKMFKRPGDEEEDERGNHHKSPLSSDKSRGKMFKRPGDEEEDESGDRHNKSLSGYRGGSGDERRRGYDDGRDRKRGWRKSSPQSDERGAPRWKKQDDAKLKEEMEDVRRNQRSRKKSSSASSSSSSSCEDDDRSLGQSKHPASDDEPAPQAPPKVLSEAELNALAAKVLRADIMGDEKLASELKATLEEARRVRESSKGSDGAGPGSADFVHSKRMEREGRKKPEEEEDGDDNVVVLSRTNKAGMVRPVLSSGSEEWGKKGGKKRKRKNVATHSDSGERTKYFHDDDNFDLKTLVEREKAGTAEDQNSMFARLAGRETDRDMDVDDMFVSKAARKNEEAEATNRDKLAAIMEHRKRSSAMEKCTRCFDKVPKHLIVAIGRKSYLCLPDHASLTEGHCLIVPMAHSSSATSMDEDVWQDMQLFRKSLVQMFSSQDKDVVVMETVKNLKHFPHTAIECVPLEQEVGDLAPIYFKKAMQEVGPEWAHNKKVHELSKKDIRHTVPKGFPYFSVDFGLQGGFAHVIEDEATFDNYFGREIVGGMLDVEPGLWRKPRKQNFEDQRQKVLQFEQWWSAFDWTQDLG